MFCPLDVFSVIKCLETVLLHWCSFCLFSCIVTAPLRAVTLTGYKTVQFFQAHLHLQEDGIEMYGAAHSGFDVGLLSCVYRSLCLAGVFLHAGRNDPAHSLTIAPCLIRMRDD